MNGIGVTAGSAAPTRTPVAPAGNVNDLSRRECFALLQASDVGRVVYTDGALPAVTPVNFVLDRDRIVLRTATTGQLAQKLPGAIVAFEVDQLERAARSGWSVVLTGPCERVTEPARLAEVDHLPLEPWVAGEMPVVLEISAAVVTGRRVAARTA